MQSEILQWNRLDPYWLKSVADVLTEAATKVDESGQPRYPDSPSGEPNWYKIQYPDHIEHILEHAVSLLGILHTIRSDGDGTEITQAQCKAIQEHASHLACRSMFLFNRIHDAYSYQDGY